MRKRAPARRAPLAERIDVHDRHQFELKLEYEPSDDEATGKYEVETYMFIPGNLNVSPATVPPRDFYTDIHNYVRLKTPELSWEELEALPDSPLVRARTEAQRVVNGADPSPFVYECKLFATVFRGTLRDLRTRVEISVGRGLWTELAAQVDEALAGASRVLRTFRRIQPITAEPTFPERARAAFRLADEAASLAVEQRARKAIVALKKWPESAEGRALQERLLQQILAEEAYRKEMGYPAFLDPKTDNESYVYRSGLLKKYCSSALFLEILRHDERKKWQELSFAIAAGIAMAFATGVAVWAQSRWSNVPSNVIVALVVAYMFKDRIKDAARSFFSHFLERHLFDRRIDLEDPAGGALGVFREKIEYLPARRVPADVLELRRACADPTARVAVEELAETITCYHKEVVLETRALAGRTGAGGVTDILRFHIDRLLREMDERYTQIEWIDRQTFQVEPLKAAKVYHVDVAFRFTSADRQPVVRLTRLILDRRGIKRIERLPA